MKLVKGIGIVCAFGVVGLSIIQYKNRFTSYPTTHHHKSRRHKHSMRESLFAENTDQNGLIPEILIKAFQEIKQNYVDEINERRLIENGLAGMLSALDPFSGYLNESDYQKTIHSFQGELLGIGVELISDKNGLKIINVIPNSPADKASIKPSDIITHINGHAIKGISETEALLKLKGHIGKKVQLTTLHESTPRTVTLTISIIPLDQLSISIQDQIIFVRIPQLTDQSIKKLQKFMLEKAAALIEKNEIQGLILDLRNNPGGSLEQAIQITEMFLDSGIIVKIYQRTAKESQTIQANGKDLLHKRPMIVLINHGTVSSAEIIAAALKDNQRAVIIGERSFGKSSIQSLYRFPGFGAIKMTTSHFLSPRGICITNNGVNPDIAISEKTSFPTSLPSELHSMWEKDSVLTYGIYFLKQNSMKK